MVNGYRVKCQNYKRMADREKEMRRREEKLGRSEVLTYHRMMYRERILNIISLFL